MMDGRHVGSLSSRSQREALGPVEGQYFENRALFQEDINGGDSCYDVYGVPLAEGESTDLCVILELGSPLTSGFAAFGLYDWTNCRWVSQADETISVGEDRVTHCFSGLAGSYYLVYVYGQNVPMPLPYTLAVESSIPPSRAVHLDLDDGCDAMPPECNP